jgi:type II secretory pathway pseudopilin PulG
MVTSSSTPKKQLFGINAFTLSELLVSLGVLGLIAGLTVPSIVTAVDRSKTLALEKEAFTYMTHIITEGYHRGDFDAMTDFTVDETTDPIVQYFMTRLNFTQHCPKGTVTGLCGTITHGATSTTHVWNDHSARWVISQDMTIGLVGGHTSATYFLFTMNSKPNRPNGGKPTAVVCNVSNRPLTITTTAIDVIPLNPGTCGPWWYNQPFFNPT